MTSPAFILPLKEKSGGTATPIINRGDWDRLLVAIPPLNEQKRIVNCINELSQLLK